MFKKLGQVKNIIKQVRNSRKMRNGNDISRTQLNMCKNPTCSNLRRDKSAYCGKCNNPHAT